jgi:hypothetical protein
MSAVRCGPVLANGFVIACAAFVAPNAALAYSARASFSAPAMLAGGGGRYFTGSPADGYTCKACHTGGADPTLDVVGIPFGGYRPNARYEMRVQWPDEIEKFSAALEITDLKGRRAGTLQLPPDEELEDEEYCGANSGGGVAAASLSAAPDDRQVINLPDCGAKRLRFLWRAPTFDIGPVWFAGSAVVSDGQADVLGDGVADFGHIIGSISSQGANASSTTGSCSAVVAPRSRLSVWPWLLLLAAAARRRWRRSAHSD